MNILKLLGIGCLSGCLIFLSNMLSSFFVVFVCFLFVVSYISVSLSSLYSKFSLTAYLNVAFIILASHFSAKNALYMSIVSAAIIMAYNLFLWPLHHKHFFKKTLFQTSQAIYALQHIFLDIYIKRNYKTHLLKYEKKIYQHCDIVLEKIMALKKNAVSSLEKNITQQLQKLFESVVAQGHLRYRIEDEATFEIIQAELKMLLNKSRHVVSALEDVYYNTLQVVSAEPQAFLFFIQAVKEAEKYQNELNIMMVNWQDA